MNTELTQSLINVLGRRVAVLIDSPRETFMLDLQSFLRFLKTDSQFKPYAERLAITVNDAYDEYTELLKENEQKAKSLKDKICNTIPEMDDSDAEEDQSKVHDWEYEYTFAHFEAVLGDAYRPPLYLSHDPLRDESKADKLIDIIDAKINKYQDENKNDEDKCFPRELLIEFQDLKAQQKYAFLEFNNYCRIAPGIALYQLEQITKRINPPPRPAKEWHEMPTLDKLNTTMRKIAEEGRYEWIVDATYGIISEYANHKPRNLSANEIDDIFKRVKDDLKRFAEGLRNEIQAAGSELTLLHRYKTRCQWYNQDALRDKLSKPKKTKIQKEHILTTDLALFMFDQGITTFYRPRFGKHEPDLIQEATSNPLFIEVKVYNRSAKATIISGMNQLHSYLCNIEAWRYINRAYYVYFRISGPIYELPREIRTNRFTIVPILIDIAPASESGRKQPRAIIIDEDEIMKGLKRSHLVTQTRSKDDKPS